MNKKGFTFIELLVWFAIVAVVVALLLPSIGSIRKKQQGKGEVQNVTYQVTVEYRKGVKADGEEIEVFKGVKSIDTWNGPEIMLIFTDGGEQILYKQDIISYKKEIEKRR